MISYIQAKIQNTVHKNISIAQKLVVVIKFWNLSLQSTFLCKIILNIVSGNDSFDTLEPKWLVCLIQKVRDLQKKMQHVENELDNTLEKLGVTNVKLDEKDKAFQLAEGEIQALQRKLVLLQDEHQRSENKLAQTTTDLNEASTLTDEINRAIKTLETKNMIDEESK